MRGFFGLCLLLLGISLGAYVYSPDDIDRQMRVADLTRILSPTGHEARYVVTPAAASTNYASDTPLYSHSAPIVTKTQARLSPSSGESDRVGALSEAASPVRATVNDASNQPVVSAPRAVLIQPTSWATVVKANPYDRTPVAAPKALKPVNDNARYELIRNLQRQLKQLGCYHGDVDGDWGPGSKRAMTAFMSRVNASLPIEEADYIQLALLDAHREVSCADSCAVGYAKTSDGRCRANEIIAHAPARSPPAHAATRVSRTAPLTTASINRSGSLAPSAAEVITPPRPQLATRSIQIDDYRERVAKTSPRRMKTAARRAPLPGRMTVGGPPSSEVSARERAPGVSALPSVGELNSIESDKATKQRRAEVQKAVARKVKTRAAIKEARKKKRSNAKKRRYSKAARQRALFRQAFGDNLF